MLVHCGTDLVDRWRGQFPELEFAGNRALHLSKGEMPVDALRSMNHQALSYHQR